MSNCKPGDLAVIVDLKGPLVEQANGTVVIVIREAPDRYWIVRSPRLVYIRQGPRRGSWVYDPGVPEENLRPIRPDELPEGIPQRTEEPANG